MSYYGKTINNFQASATHDIPWNGSTGMFAVSAASFNSTAVTLQHKIGDYWVDFGSDAILTANGAVIFSSSSTELRVSVSSGSGNPTSGVILVQQVAENKAF
jgi:hypothetical protein